MILELGTTTTTLADPSQYPYARDTELIQAKELSASGVTHIESFKVQLNTFTFSFNDMSNLDYIALHEFFVNVAQGMLYEFSLTDDLGVTRLVRFTQPKLAFVTASLGLWQGAFVVEEVI